MVDIRAWAYPKTARNVATRGARIEAGARVVSANLLLMARHALE